MRRTQPYHLNHQLWLSGSVERGCKTTNRSCQTNCSTSSTPKLGAILLIIHFQQNNCSRVYLRSMFLYWRRGHSTIEWTPNDIFEDGCYIQIWRGRSHPKKDISQQQFETAEERKYVGALLLELFRDFNWQVQVNSDFYDVCPFEQWRGGRQISFPLLRALQTSSVNLSYQ